MSSLKAFAKPERLAWSGGRSAGAVVLDGHETPGAPAEQRRQFSSFQLGKFEVLVASDRGTFFFRAKAADGDLIEGAGFSDLGVGEDAARKAVTAEVVKGLFA